MQLCLTNPIQAFVMTRALENISNARLKGGMFSERN